MGNEFIQQIPPEWYWLFLFVSVFIENVFPPYPGDTVVVFSGYVYGTGNISFPYLAISIVAGNLISATVMYYFGLEIMEFAMKHIRSRNLKKVFSKDTLTQTHKWFEKYGFFAVVFSRFSAGIRFFVAIVAGMVQMHISIFLLAFFLATVLWNSLLVYGGYALGKNSHKLLHYMKLYSGAVTFIIIAVVTIILFRVNKKEEEEELHKHEHHDHAHTQDHKHKTVHKTEHPEDHHKKHKSGK